MLKKQAKAWNSERAKLPIVMGQIVIDIPQKKNIRYKIDGPNANVILSTLKEVGVPVKNTATKLRKRELEALQDAEDLEIARKRWANFVRSGEKGHTIEELQREIENDA